MFGSFSKENMSLAKDLKKEMKRTLKILPEISYIFVGIALFAFIWCVLIFWFYFPCDLGVKLYKKLNT